MRIECCFIIPYFGKLPNYFSLFLKSCSKNIEFEWLIFTDDKTYYDYPENVKPIYMTFHELYCLISEKFDFTISLQKPRKLCDFKPAYGLIFEEYLMKYPFWGYCDLDVIFGDLSKFLNAEFLRKYDKLFCLGHMTIFKNTWENNRLFMKSHNGVFLYKNVFTNNNICWFDEEYKDFNNINKIFQNLSKEVFTGDFSLNLYISNFRFFRCIYTCNGSASDLGKYLVEKYIRAVYFWKDGKIYRCFKSNNELIYEEFMYIHLQSRKMYLNEKILLFDTFKIIPNSFDFIEFENVTLHNINKIKNIQYDRFLIFQFNKYLRICIPSGIKNFIKNTVNQADL